MYNWRIVTALTILMFAFATPPSADAQTESADSSSLNRKEYIDSGSWIREFDRLKPRRQSANWRSTALCLLGDSTASIEFEIDPVLAYFLKDFSKVRDSLYSEFDAIDFSTLMGQQSNSSFVKFRFKNEQATQYEIVIYYTVHNHSDTLIHTLDVLSHQKSSKVHILNSPNIYKQVLNKKVLARTPEQLDEVDRLIQFCDKINSLGSLHHTARFPGYILPHAWSTALANHEPQRALGYIEHLLSLNDTRPSHRFLPYRERMIARYLLGDVEGAVEDYKKLVSLKETQFYTDYMTDVAMR